MFLRNMHFGTAHENVRENTDVAEFCDGVLRRLGLEFACSLEVRHQSQVDKASVFDTDFKTELPCRFEERERFNIACNTADFAQDNVCAAFGCRAECILDFVRDVRNDLYRTAQVMACTFLRKYGRINTARSVA